MANVDLEYFDLLQDVLDNGFEYEDPNRSGVKRLQIPEAKIELLTTASSGFNQITTKQTSLRIAATEFLWVLTGKNDLKYLLDNNVNIWNKDAYNYYLRRLKSNKFFASLSKQEQTMWNDAIAKVGTSHSLTLERFITGVKSENIPREIANIGEVYGGVLRRSATDSLLISELWSDPFEDFIQNLLNNPYNTNLVCSLAPNHNYKKFKQALPACHWSFQVVVNDPKTKSLKLIWNQRSTDVFLGLPYNIMFYTLLARFINVTISAAQSSQSTGWSIEKLEGNLKNVHLYTDHIAVAKQQLSRNPYRFKSPVFEGFDPPLASCLVNDVINKQYVKPERILEEPSLFYLNPDTKDIGSYGKLSAEMFPYDE